PVPFYFIIRKTSMTANVNGANILMTRMAMGSLFVGLATYPFFLIYGYGPVTLGSLHLPASVILSGVVMLFWYGFMAGYLKVRNYIEPDSSITYFDFALVMLFISSLGAWGVAVVQFAGTENPLYGKALTHLFLATFTEGWVVLILLGMLYERLSLKSQSGWITPKLGGILIFFGAPLTFPFGISESLLTRPLLYTAITGSIMTATGLGINLFIFTRESRWVRTWFWKTVLVLLGLKVAVQLFATLLPAEYWISDHGLRVFYLHLLLLGAFTVGVFVVLYDIFDARNGLLLLTVSVALVLMSLILYTPLWPTQWMASWLFYGVAVLALLPAIAALYCWVALWKQSKINR
ncbi:MAG: hypothetical protein R3283_08935, partial [Balneolaceae bacterium]|nr:hypothetical protein [Balneolaceae bacterium]